MDIQKSEANYNMIDWFKKVVFNNYANFDGRARRSEYWWFTLCSFFIYIIPYMIMMYSIMNTIADEGELVSFNKSISIPMIILFVIYLVLLIPSLAVTFRRLHDTNKSGWYLLLAFVPFVSIILLVFFFQDGNRCTNNYGPDPKNPYQNDFDFEHQQANQSTAL